MRVTAISTLEINLSQGSEVALEKCLVNFASQMRSFPGCVAFTLIRSTNLPKLWILSGYWSSEADMRYHYCAFELQDLLATMQQPSLRLEFASFVCKALQEDGHVAR